jgi:hypothetical protein
MAPGTVTRCTEDGCSLSTAQTDAKVCEPCGNGRFIYVPTPPPPPPPVEEKKAEDSAALKLAIAKWGPLGLSEIVVRGFYDKLADTEYLDDILNREARKTTPAPLAALIEEYVKRELSETSIRQIWFSAGGNKDTATVYLNDEVQRQNNALVARLRAQANRGRRRGRY